MDATFPALCFGVPLQVHSIVNFIVNFLSYSCSSVISFIYLLFLSHFSHYFLETFVLALFSLLFQQMVFYSVVLQQSWHVTSNICTVYINFLVLPVSLQCSRFFECGQSIKQLTCFSMEFSVCCRWPLCIPYAPSICSQFFFLQIFLQKSGQL